MAIPALAAQRMIQLFIEKQRRGGFLASFFRPVPGSTGGKAKSLSWDVVRWTDTLAGTKDPDTGATLNTVDQFSTKDLVPPTYSEKIAIDVNDLVNRIAGEDPYSASNREYTSRFLDKANTGVAQIVAKFDRSIELQASQILQTCKLALPGEQPFAADFLPKSSHFVTVGVAWSDQANCKPLTDMEALSNQIRSDSRQTVTRAIMGRTALREFLDSDQVTTTADVRRMNLIDIDPRLKDRGASRYGVVIANGFEIELWHYPEEYTPFGGGAKVRYVEDNKVILLPAKPGLVVGSLKLPNVVKPDPRVSRLILPPTKSELGYDLTPNVWTTPEGNVVYAGVRSKIVLFPQEVDGFGALTT